MNAQASRTIGTTIETEATEAGEQMLVSGARPITTGERLTALAARPMQPKRNPYASQKPCDIGLFDQAARDQTDLIDFLQTIE